MNILFTFKKYIKMENYKKLQLVKKSYKFKRKVHVW